MSTKRPGVTGLFGDDDEWFRQRPSPEVMILGTGVGSVVSIGLGLEGPAAALAAIAPTVAAYVWSARE